MNLDDSERVIYIGSFSKTILPGLRLGFLVVPHGAWPIAFRARSPSAAHAPR